MKPFKFKDPFQHPQFAPNQGKKWTEEQQSTITNPQLSITEAARRSGKTVRAIQVKRSKLKWEKPKVK